MKARTKIKSKKINNKNWKKGNRVKLINIKKGTIGLKRGGTRL